MSAISVADAIDRWSEIDRPESSIGLRSIIALDPDAEDRTNRVSGGDGPLTGVPVVLKDNIEADGLPCTAGSLALREVPIGADSPVADRLRRAGAVIIGAANLSEWANIRSTRSSSGWSAVGGLVGNPWALDRSAGGSSSGSGAAVAAGIVSMAVGTETDGSITCPAALNGVVGIKPTVGLVPTDGIVPVSASQDTPGPLARTVDEAALMLAVLSDDPGLVTRSRSNDVSSLKIGVVDAWRTGHSATDALFDDLLGLLASDLFNLSPSKMVATPEDVQADEFTVLVHELRSDLDAYLARRVGHGGPRSLIEVVAFNRDNASVELAHFGQEIFEMAAASSGREAPEYRAARARNLEWVRNHLLVALAQHEVLIAPAYMPAWKTDFVLGHPPAGGAVTTPAAIAGLPTVTIPMGLVAGLPVALSLVGGARSEAQLIAVARAIENELGLVDDPQWGPQFIAPTRG
ncbi:MAG: amidase family protein [Ilumatobacteraceae bacterium]